MSIEIIKPLLIAVISAVVRSVAGWAKNALADKKITRFELRKLSETVIRVGLIAGCGYFIATGLLDIDPGLVETIGIGAAAILTDKLFSVIKENKSVK